MTAILLTVKLNDLFYFRTGPVKSHTQIIIPIIPVPVTNLFLSTFRLFESNLNSREYPMKMHNFLSIGGITAVWQKKQKKNFLLYLFACATHNIDTINK